MLAIPSRNRVIFSKIKSKEKQKRKYGKNGEERNRKHCDFKHRNEIMLYLF